MKSKIMIIGAGGHGKVLCDVIVAQGLYEIVGFVDSVVPVGTLITNGYKIVASQENIDKLKNAADFFIIAIGNNEIRKMLFETASSFLKPAVIIHPSAVIGTDVTVGEGAVVLANAVINAFSVVGANTIVNAGVVVDHDNIIGSHVHLAIGTMVGSHSIIADSFSSQIGERINSFSKVGLA